MARVGFGGSGGGGGSSSGQAAGPTTTVTHGTPWLHGFCVAWFWWHHVATLDDVQTRVEEKTETVSVSLLLAFDPNGDESVHPCVEEDR